MELSNRISRLRNELIELDDSTLLQHVGIYEYHHPLDKAANYKEALRHLRELVREEIRRNRAVSAAEQFAYNNSLAQGRKMVADFSKLMLRTYNAEAENCVRTVKAGTLPTATKRLVAAKDSIAKLGSMMDMSIAETYHSLRLQELELTADYMMKVQVEREDAREERARLREERRAEQELAAERDRLNKERSHYQNALVALKAKGETSGISDLEDRLGNIQNALEENDYRAANIRAGYVYVISNIGAFGMNVVKIGMTRRLDPLDRVRELGDASVPFPFDIHALYFSDDAVTLENELHASFADKRLNHVNQRREFFFATPWQVHKVLANKVGNLLEYTEKPEATQYFQSTKYWPQSDRTSFPDVQMTNSIHESRPAAQGHGNAS